MAPTAFVVGDVTIGTGTLSWFEAVNRADFAAIVIGTETNDQDGSVIHNPPHIPTFIGYRVTIAHMHVIHGATLGDDSAIANRATVLDDARVGLAP